MNEYIKAFISLSTRKKKVLNHPISVIVDASTECNLHCKMCHRNQAFFQKPDRKFLSTDTLRNLFAQISPKTLSFGGLLGEPLTNKDICELVKIVTENHCKALLTSNGLLLTEEVSTRLIENGIHIIKISVDAATKETYRKIRNSNHFDKLINNIKRLGDIEEERRNQREAIRMEYVFQNDNLDEVVPFLHLAKELKISNITYLPLNYMPLSRESEHSFKQEYNLERIITTMEEAIEVASKLHITTNMPFLFRKAHKIKDVKNYMPDESDRFYLPWYKYTQGKYFLCVLPWLELTMDIDGNVSICCVPFTPGRNGNGLIIGNAGEGNLLEIWNGEKAQKLRKLCSTKKNYELFDICHRCLNRPDIYEEIKKNKLFRFSGIKSSFKNQSHIIQKNHLEYKCK